jgi:hypothetical protein
MHSEDLQSREIAGVSIWDETKKHHFRIFAGNCLRKYCIMKMAKIFSTIMDNHEENFWRNLQLLTFPEVSCKKGKNYSNMWKKGSFL